MNINLNYIKKIKFDLKSPKHCSHETFILVHELHLRGLLHPKSLESSKGRKEEEVPAAHPHLSREIPREKARKPRGLLGERGLRSGDVRSFPLFNPPEDVVLERDTHPWLRDRDAKSAAPG